MKYFLFSLIFPTILLNTSLAAAFQFSLPSDGEKVLAGSTIRVRIEPGDIDPLFGVLLSGIPAGTIETRLDSLLPFEWSVKIPDHFHGTLTLRAVGRRYIPIPNPPRTAITVIVVHPAISISYPISSPDLTHP